jgi:tRNA nucleotidyltransferase (CCA-adding enzyme)
MLLITHYQRLLDYIKPTHVHIISEGKIVKTGDYSLVKEIEKNGFKAYIVGGYARDLYLNRKSYDVDICTSATPMDLRKIFKNIKINDSYGSIILNLNNVRFEITTFREEGKYKDFRRPDKINYTSSLDIDIQRRDFIINTLCIDKDGNFVDLLNARKDIDNKIIRCVGNPKIKIKEDVLRILRAIRFSTILDFDIDKDLEKYILRYKFYLRKLSFYRKKEELDKIFSSVNKEKGIKLLLDLGLYYSLDIKKLSTIVITSDAIGIWTQLNVDNKYPFTKNEKELMKKIRNLSKNYKINNRILYDMGLYIPLMAAEINNENTDNIKKIYMNLPIKSRSDINITANEICKELNIKPSHIINEIYNKIETEILDGKLENDNKKIKIFIKKVML